MCADTFGVGIHLTETELQFVVHVPSDIDAGWTDPEAFQSAVSDAVWERLDQQTTLEHIADQYETGETVSLGTISLTPEKTVTTHNLSAPNSEHANESP